MKRSLCMAAGCLLLTGLCSAQGDSVRATADSVTVTVATEMIASDSVIVIRIHAADLAIKTVEEIVLKGEQPYAAPEMTLGFRFFSLDDFPGTMFFQKKMPSGAYIGIGAVYRRGHYDSQGEYWSLYGDGRDTGIVHESAWSAAVNMDIEVAVKRYRGWSGVLGFTALYGYGKTDSTLDHDGQWPYTLMDTEVRSKYSRIGFGVDLRIEKEFHVAKTAFTIGVINPLIYFEKTHEIVDQTYSYYYYSGSSSTYRIDNKRPWQFGYNNPLSGRIGLQLKYLFY
jgi:hypothetical protein